MRRYDEEEIAEIFKRAVADRDASRPGQAGGGLSLAEIQAIGRETGIAPEAIARAAAGLEAGNLAAPAPTRFLGVPVSVARTVDLPGPFMDEDWNRLVVDLHDTFHVYGERSGDGTTREWRGGGLHVLVEPTGGGHRLRLRGVNEPLLAGMGISTVFFFMGLFFMLVVAVKGGFSADLTKMMVMSLFSGGGLAGFGVSASRLQRWRAMREGQMDAVATRAVERAAAPTGRLAAEDEVHEGRIVDEQGDAREHEDTPASRRRTRS